MARLRYYLLKATYDWIVEHDLTPYFHVDTSVAGVEVPKSYIEDDEIVLDAAPDAVDQFFITPTEVHFQATFSDDHYHVRFPLDAILGLYAEESEQGIYQVDMGEWALAVNEGDEENLDPKPDVKPMGRGHLKLVK